MILKSGIPKYTDKYTASISVAEMLLSVLVQSTTWHK